MVDLMCSKSSEAQLKQKVKENFKRKTFFYGKTQPKHMKKIIFDVLQLTAEQ